MESCEGLGQLASREEDHTARRVPSDQIQNTEAPPLSLTPQGEQESYHGQPFPDDQKPSEAPAQRPWNSSDLLASESPSERPWHDPSAQPEPHEASSDEDLSTEQMMFDASADHFSHEAPLEQLLRQASLHHPSHDVFGEQDSHHTLEEEELPDDVKRAMLADICKGVVILTRESQAPGGCCYVYLVGTAHVSQESCREVQAATSFLKPQVVFLELCEKRRFMLSSAHFQVPTVSEMLGMWKEKRSNLLGILYGWFLAKVAAKMDVFPGSEFRVAYEEAKACGAKVVLGDRDVQVTLRRTWGKMNLWYKTKFIFGMVFQAFSLPSVEDLKEMIQGLQDVDMLTLAFQELSKSFPTLMETLVHERDMFMTAVLQKVAEDHSSIVAVVGRGHIPGITRYWDQDILVHTLMEVPRSKSIWTAAFKYYVLAALVVLTSAFLLHVYSHSR